jgi:hypothetical protein
VQELVAGLFNALPAVIAAAEMIPHPGKILSIQPVA